MRIRGTGWRGAVSARSLIALGAILAGLGTWLTGAPVLGALREHPYFSIDSLRIEGYGPRLGEAEVRRWLDLDARPSVWDVDPAWVLGRLRSHPLVAWASVRRQFPGTFEVRLRERRPVAVLLLDDLYYVDRGGAVFGPLGIEDDHDFPVITGISAESPAGQRRWAVRRALRLLRLADGESGFTTGVSELHFDAVLGTILYPTTPRVPVLLGWGNLREKLDRAGRVLTEWEGMTERLAKVDARFRGQVVVKLRPEEMPRTTGARS
jgi:cell division protein FtsQ